MRELDNEAITFLVVDDEREVRSSLRGIFEGRGHRVIEAESGLEGLRLYAREHPDIVLVALELPELDGLTMIARLNQRFRQVPIIAILESGTTADVFVAVQQAAWSFLIKPVREDGALELALSQTIGRIRLLEENVRYREQLEQKVREKTRELVESKERYQRLLESITSYVFTVHLEGGEVVQTVHHSGCRGVTGYDPDDFYRDPELWYRIVHHDDRPLVLEVVQGIETESRHLEIEHRIRHRDGSIRWVRNTLVPCLDLEGTLLSYDGVIVDITERKEAEETMRQASAYHRRLIEASLDPLVTIGPDGTITDVNSATERVIGYTRDEIIGTDFSEYFVEPENARQVYQLVFRDGLVRDYPLELKHRNGPITSVLYNATVYRDGSGKVVGVFAAARDITERKLSEARTKRHLENLKALRVIDETISGSLNLHICLNVLLRESLQQLQVDAACVLALNPHSQALEYADGQGFCSDLIGVSQLRVGEGLAGRVARERRTRVIHDLQLCDDPEVPHRLVAREGFRSYVGVPLIAKGQVKGVFEIFHRGPLACDREWLAYAETLAGQGAIALDNAELFDNLQRSNSELLLAYDTTIEGWSRALDYRDKETEGHSRRVTECTVRIAKSMGIHNGRLVHVRRGALLHDIGKLGVPDQILLKPGPLTEEEFSVMQQHTEIAYRLLAPIEFLRPAVDIPYLHHEKWDGTGYPRGLNGKEIPLPARIFAIVDVWDALSSDRPYRKAWEPERVRDYLLSQSGIHFDPEVVEVFDSLLRQEGSEGLRRKSAWPELTGSSRLPAGIFPAKEEP